MRLSGPAQHELAQPGVDGRIVVACRVMDADGELVDDALVELWQATAAGRYRHPVDERPAVSHPGGFLGYGRAALDPETREYRFITVKPGRVPAPDGSRQAPHISVVVQGRGLLGALFTRLYFPDEPRANADDFILARVPAERRRTLVATNDTSSSVALYRFDIRLQGPDETVFFAF
jgi:protocatechuate 3,4-dioxygenase alpha subunit